jgi:hypothetical protein
MGREELFAASQSIFRYGQSRDIYCALQNRSSDQMNDSFLLHTRQSFFTDMLNLYFGATGWKILKSDFYASGTNADYRYIRYISKNRTACVQL